MSYGESASFVALLLEGTLQCTTPNSASSQSKRLLHAGTALGYAALFQAGERESDVTAASEAVLALISFLFFVSESSGKDST